MVVISRTSLEFHLILPTHIHRNFLQNWLHLKSNIIVLITRTSLERSRIFVFWMFIPLQFRHRQRMISSLIRRLPLKFYGSMLKRIPYLRVIYLFLPILYPKRFILLLIASHPDKRLRSQNLPLPKTYLTPTFSSRDLDIVGDSI
jgi:hypothetical protein